MRKPMVTRTFITMEVVATVLDTEHQTVQQKTLTLSRVYKENKILEKTKEMYDTETEKVVHIVSTKEVENLYGMDEQDFLKHAKKLDAKRKELATEATEEAAEAVAEN